MRLRRLDLIRYGHFTDTSIDLPPGEPDLRVIYGPNEAGKSTARAALDDLLYGFGTKSNYAFIHEYNALRIGGVIEGEPEPIDIVRKKGRKNTILNREDLPDPAAEAALNRALANTDTEFFARMFSLNQVRLREGADQLLVQDGDGDSGLLAAGAGITDLLSRRKALSEEANRLWSPHKSKERAYYQADTRFKSAEAAMREHEVTATQWKKLKAAYQDSEDAYESIKQQRREQQLQRDHLLGIRSVMPHVRQYQELQEALNSLGEVVSLSENAQSVFDAAAESINNANVGIREQQARVDTISHDLEITNCDDALLARAEDIESLIERRGRVVEENEKLADLKVQLGASEKAARAQALTLKWDASDLDVVLKCVPEPHELKMAAELRHAYGQIAERNQSAAERVLDSQFRHDQMEERLSVLGQAIDLSGLEALVTSLKGDSGAPVQLQTAKESKQRSQREIDKLLQAMEPSVDEALLEALSVPARHEVDQYIKSIPKADAVCDKAGSALSEAEEKLDQDRLAYEQELDDEGLASEEEIRLLRAHRDQGWLLIRKEHFDGQNADAKEIAAFIDEHANEAVAYEAAVEAADKAADQRFDKAETAGQLKEKARSINLQSERLKSLTKAFHSTQEDRDALTQSWLTLWELAPFKPAPPPVMRDWLGMRQQVLEYMLDRAAAINSLEQLETRLAEDAKRLRDALQSVGVADAAMKQEAFATLLARAESVLQAEHIRDQERRNLQEDLARHKPELERHNATAEECTAALEQWQAEWSKALTALALNKELSAAQAQTPLDTLAELGEFAQRIRETGIAIEQIEAHQNNFKEAVQWLSADVASDLAGQSELSASNQLKTRLQQARQTRQSLDSWTNDLGKAENRIRELRREQEEADHTLEGLHADAGTTEREVLAQIIKRSDNHRQLLAEREKTEEALAAQGDGRTLAELIEQCEEKTLDEISAALPEFNDSLSDLEPQVAEALEARNDARGEFNAVGGDEAYAIAAAERSQALADMRDAAEGYARVGAASILLKWAAERYRLEKLQPLISRASELFAKLTLGSFEKLVPEFDDEKMHIAGYRGNGEHVRVENMSEGTRDQLFLALRVASLEDYLDRGTVLPFVADDLFVNFDDERSLAGLQVLCELSAKTQVLFFTHHQHLCDLAIKATKHKGCVVRLEA